jgi:hypothetical protein
VSGKSGRVKFQRDGGRFSLSANGVGGEGRGEVVREPKMDFSRRNQMMMDLSRLGRLSDRKILRPAGDVW